MGARISARIGARIFALIFCPAFRLGLPVQNQWHGFLTTSENQKFTHPGAQVFTHPGAQVLVRPMGPWGGLRKGATAAQRHPMQIEIMMQMPCQASCWICQIWHSVLGSLAADTDVNANQASNDWNNQKEI